MLGFNSGLSFYYSIICIFLGVVYSYLLYNKQKNIGSTSLFWGLFIFRTFLISIISFLLLSPIVKSNINSIEKPIVIIAKDNSESVKEDINTELQILEGNLKDFDIYKYSFSDDIYQGIEHKNIGLKTNYSNLFLEFNSRFENKNIAAIVVASDGCYNTGNNPEFITYNFPVYSVALGDTTMYKDIRIDNVLKNEITFLGNTFPLQISLSSSVPNSEISKITIWNKGIKLYEEGVSFSADKDFKTVELQLDADKVGLNTYIIKLEGLQGEKNLHNNIYRAYVDVIDSKYNVLILKDKSHPDIAAFKSVVDKNKNYKVEIKNIEDDIFLEKHQLVVLFGIEDIPSYLIESNIPLIIFNSSQSHYKSLGSLVSFTSKGGVEEVSVSRNQYFSKFTFSPDLIRLVNSAPPLTTIFGKFLVNGQLEYVLNQKIGSFVSDNPVIMIQEVDARKIAFVSAEGWWKWKLYDYSTNNHNDAFDELFSKISQYLVLQEDKSLFRITYEKQYEENSDVILRGALYNESYELINNKEVELRISDTDNNEYIFQFSKESDEYLVDIGVLPVGEYNFTAKVKGSNLKERGAFDVKKIQLEQLNLVANHQILRKIANISGGKVFYKSDMNILADELNNSDRNKRVIHSKEKLESLINISWVLLVLLVIISLEWFIRKYHGLI
ncbi:hypothetical protein OAK24_01800 [Flavobacteriales bacterium]|nr:hypothetical protein [Flavobacteriales bacterium]